MQEKLLKLRKEIYMNSMTQEGAKNFHIKKEDERIEISGLWISAYYEEDELPSLSDIESNFQSIIIDSEIAGIKTVLLDGKYSLTGNTFSIEFELEI